MSQPLVPLLLLLTCLPMVACTNPQTAGSGPVSPGTGGTVTLDPAVVPDGWARAAGAPASPGGTGAPASRTFTVTTRAQFVAAVTNDLTKVIVVEGMVDLSTDAAGKHLDAVDYLAQAGYTYPSYAAYQAAYIAGCAGATTAVPNPVPGLKSVQVAAAAKQKAVVVIPVGSNTTLLGKGNDAGFVNGSLSISGKTNIVVRNLSLLDSYDAFPVWDPTDSNGGMVNSAYDTVSITNGSTYLWIDHCRLGDGARSDSTLPWYTISGVASPKEWVTHDGLVDVTNGSNYVTLSWNRIEDHNKTMLFGSSDSSTVDAGKLKVTAHHNWFTGVTQRLPRVRFGQVHLYNNYYETVGSYAVGVGDQARIYSEANDFSGTSHAFDKYDHTAAEGYFYDVGSLNLGGTETMATAALVGWTPGDVYAYSVDPVGSVKALVTAGAGVGRL